MRGVGRGILSMLLAASLLLWPGGAALAGEANPSGARGDLAAREMARQGGVLPALQCGARLAGGKAEISEGGVSFPNQIRVHDGFSGSFIVAVSGISAQAKIKKVTISDESVASVSRNGGQIWIRAKKPGKAVIRFRVVGESGREDFKSNLTVYRYENPLRSYKIGGTEIKGRFSKGSSSEYAVKKAGNAKISLEAKKGWRIKSFSYRHGGEVEYFSTGTAKVRLRKAKGASIQANFVSEKTGVVENLILWIRF